MLILDLETIPVVSASVAVDLAAAANVFPDGEPMEIADAQDEAEKYASLTPPLAQIAVAGLWNKDHRRAFVNMQSFGGDKGEPIGEIIPCIGERTLVETVFGYIGNRERWPLVTFNGRRFDLPVLLAAALRHAIPVPLAVRELMLEYRYSKTPQHHDLYDLLTFYGAGKGSLRAWCVGLGLGDPKEHGDGSRVAELCRAGKVKEAAEYCLGDCEKTGQLFLRYQECMR